MPALPPECAYFPVSPICLAPLLRQLPACAQHLWVYGPHGWSCVPTTPPAPQCQPPFTMPVLLSRAWECLGGPGPVVLPMPPHKLLPMVRKAQPVA